MNGDVRERSFGMGQVALMDGRRWLVADSLRVGNPANNARELSAQTDWRHEHQIELDVEAIQPYEHNPRRADNPKFAEIKASIQAAGLRNPLTVTRRPGEQTFIVEAGGNTRLMAVQQLWAETQDVRFRRISVLFRPWRSESHVLISHLIENEQRGDMSFWDKANGMTALKTQWEAEQGRTLTARQMESELKSVGIAVSRTTLGYYRFATERLRGLGEVTAHLSGADVTRVQPRLNLIKQYAQSRASLAEDVLYEHVLQPVFRRHASAYQETRSFGADALCADCEAALALYLNESIEQCRAALDRLMHRGATDDPVQQAAAEGQDQGPENGNTTSSDEAASAPPPDKGLVTVPVAIAKQPDKTLVRPAVSPLAVDITGGGTETSDGMNKNSTLFSSTPDSTVNDTVDAFSQLRLEIGCFAHLADIAHFLRVAAQAPCGYVLDALPDGDEAVTSITRRAWSLLHLLCAHIDQVVAAGAVYPFEGAALRTPAEGVPTIDMPFLLWFFDSTDESALSFQRIMGSLMAWRASRADGFVSATSGLPQVVRG